MKFEENIEIKKFFTKYLTQFYRGFIPSEASQISRLVSCVSGGFFYIVLISTHRGTEFSRLYLSLVFK